MCWGSAARNSKRPLAAGIGSATDGAVGLDLDQVDSAALVRDTVDVVPEVPKRFHQTVISIALDQSGEFQAQKLPLLLAPRSSVSVNLATGARLSDSWQGQFAVFSDDQAAIEAAVNKLKAGTNTQIIARGDDYAILAPNSQ